MTLCLDVKIKMGGVQIGENVGSMRNKKLFSSLSNSFSDLDIPPENIWEKTDIMFSKQHMVSSFIFYYIYVPKVYQ